MERAILSITDAQDYLGGVSRNTLQALMDEDEIKYLMIGKRRYIVVASINEYIERNQRGGTRVDPDSEESLDHA